MFNKLSFKIGLLFFIFILIIESFLFFVLYINLANNRVEEVMDSLLARGNTHRDVLEDQFNQSTLEHVVIMESESDFFVIITDEEGEIITSSEGTVDSMMEIANHSNDDTEVPLEGKVVEDRWNEVEYIATDSPITVDGEHQGHVFMFADTESVKRTVNQLSNQFWVISLITIALTIGTIFLLSRFIAFPIIRMKLATEKLSEGNHNVQLNTNRKDELGELASSITKLAEDLQQSKIERNEFLASIAHELRTPLTYIKGYADIITRSDTTNKEKAEYMTIIKEETEALTLLIKHLFELAKMDERNFVINPDWINLHDLLKTVVERIQPILIDKKITIQIDCPSDLNVFIDSERFQQVFLNLFDNAQKHADEASTVKVLVSETNYFTEIKVVNKGEGIPKKDLPYIFDRLYRVEKSRSRLSGGSGLGLSITKEIVEAHGGNITIESEENKETSVMIKLPRRENDEKNINH